MKLYYQNNEYKFYMHLCLNYYWKEKCANSGPWCTPLTIS